MNPVSSEKSAFLIYSKYLKKQNTHFTTLLTYTSFSGIEITEKIGCFEACPLNQGYEGKLLMPINSVPFAISICLDKSFNSFLL